MNDDVWRRPFRAKGKMHELDAIAEGDDQDIFIIVNGTRIAKRGQPGILQARTWISLEPGWSVVGIDELVITYAGAGVH